MTAAASTLAKYGDPVPCSKMRPSSKHRCTIQQDSISSDIISGARHVLCWTGRLSSPSLKEHGSGTQNSTAQRCQSVSQWSKPLEALRDRQKNLQYSSRQRYQHPLPWTKSGVVSGKHRARYLHTDTILGLIRSWLPCKRDRCSRPLLSPCQQLGRRCLRVTPLSCSASPTLSLSTGYGYGVEYFFLHVYFFATLGEKTDQSMPWSNRYTGAAV
ncbi:hypothetical protein BDP55DRAFT_51028 [Colletotrichum godetiae]|uniref:Uncharacterized protein n=1 Tax=Colletotrichum godetiae TaxID=1209918 RepID=A0AAJ0EWE7_9PEZI|nr:uncharacterized protein BDP55DRAFT_51028 [Colletotrichum godetiae]KAK1688645.1 hypothetical protein BDP55DRAFT_51028 [Colletotrichum godetiae]